MLKLRRLKVHEYRNVVPGTELVFGDRFNVLLGQNGTGKTTLLELISMVIRSDFSRLKKEPADLEFDLAWPGASVTARFSSQQRERTIPLDGVRVRGQRPEVDHEAGLGAAFQLRVCSEDTEFDAEADTRQVRVWERQGDATTYEPCDLFLPGLLAHLLLDFHRELSDLLRRSCPYPDRAYRFDEALDAFHAMTGGPSGSVPTAVVSISSTDKSWVALRRGLVAGEIFQRLKSSGSLLESDGGETELRFNDLAMMKVAVSILGFSSATVRAELKERTVQAKRITSRYEGLRFGFVRDDGSYITHELLSFGQKRMLAFLYYLAANEDVVIADELVNGLHHRWLEECIDQIGERQVFVASQNPLLLDYLAFSDSDEVRRCFVQCRSEKLDDRRVMAWNNLSEQEASAFFSAWKVGIQHVSEILRMRGLW